MGVLVVLRGNSGSGKSAVAREVQRRLGRGRCAIIDQDYVRRAILDEADAAGAFNIQLIEAMADVCLSHRLVTLVEGILNAGRYAAMLERLTSRAERSMFYAWDVSLQETLRRHALRAKSADFGEEEMRGWYHGWQPLSFVAETRFDESVTIDAAVGRIVADLGPRGGANHP